MALIHCHFYSQVLGMMSTMTVLLPDPGTLPLSSPAGRNRYPTLYLLHGLSDDHTVWQRRTAIERYVEQSDLAVVMPAVARSFYADTITGQRYWTFISEEVPAVARHFFPLSAERNDNYVAGLSMGGYGAFKLALTYPDRFAAAASLSGVLDVVGFFRASDPAGQIELRHVFGEIDGLAGNANDLFALARRMARQTGIRPRLYQWCGTEDFLYADNVGFRDHAESLGLALTYDEGSGGHEWSCWDREIQRVLRWLAEERRARCGT